VDNCEQLVDSVAKPTAVHLPFQLRTSPATGRPHRL